MSENKPKKSIKSIVKIAIASWFGIFLLLLIAWAVNLGIHAVHLIRIVNTIQSGATQTQPAELITKLQQAADDIGAIHNDVGPLLPVLDAFQGIPVVGLYLGQADPLLQYVDGLAQAGKEITLGLQPMLEATPASSSQSSVLEQATQVMQANQLHFVNASQFLGQASQARGKIRAELLPAPIQKVYQRIDGKFNLIVAGAQVLQAAPQLLGADSPQSYLVVAQNRDELRASGGFISAIGRLVLENGAIYQFELADSYSIDDFSKPYPTPPEALKRFMLADYWVTRDANWSPDFPTASQQVQALYQLSTGNQTQGVIAFNQLAIRQLLGVTGPIQVPGTTEPVSAGNVDAYMQQAWATAPGVGITDEWWQHRKDFMPQLGLAIIDKMLSSSEPQQLLKIGEMFMHLVNTGKVLLYFNDSRAETALISAGLDGALRPGSSDYLYLVDSNVGFNKVDSVIERSVQYAVDLRDLNHPVGEATLSYNHMGTGNPVCKQEITYGNGTYQDLQQRCYLDYWRLYTPAGSQLLTGDAQPVPATQLLNGVGWSGQIESLMGEAGTQVFAGLLMLPPGQSTQISLKYSLPTGVIERGSSDSQVYSLRIQVQPGLESLPVRIQVLIPKQEGVVSPGEGWQEISNDTWTWQGSLDRMVEIHLEFSPKIH